MVQKLLRRRIGGQILGRVGGTEADAVRARIHGTPGPRWFDPDHPVCRVHGDASMFIGGIRALLLQALHPLAMAGVAGHSGYKGDPWGRLQRTSYFIAVTSFGTIEHAEAAIARVREIHERVRGTTNDGRSYAASDPHLLRWVHVAEIDSFLTAHQHFGADPLDQAGRDAYVDGTARIAEKLGVVDLPRSEADLVATIESYAGELETTAPALETSKFLLFEPPLPRSARLPYGALAAAAVGLLSTEQRRMLELLPSDVPGRDVLGRVGGRFMTRTIRWAISDPAFQPPAPPDHVADAPA